MCVVCVLYRVCLGLSVFPGIGILKIATANAVSFPKEKPDVPLDKEPLEFAAGF